MNVILEDLTHLSPKRLERRLEQLASEALPCESVTVFDGSPSEGLTVGLRVEPQGRRDVLDLARVLEIEPDGHVFSAWALLSPNRSHPYRRLLLRIHFERPVRCSFVVRLDIRDHPSDPLRAALPLILAASRFGLAFDGPHGEDQPLVWVSAPAGRDCVFDVLAAVGV
ncbi:MAG TPA: hypothetical protein VFL61_09010 [Gaiellaceae bacterium]|nr:hypothetical protein [Gaiellaceae bacterium]